LTKKEVFMRKKSRKKNGRKGRIVTMRGNKKTAPSQFTDARENKKEKGTDPRIEERGSKKREKNRGNKAWNWIRRKGRGR